jgi:hypothetical protein
MEWFFWALLVIYIIRSSIGALGVTGLFDDIRPRRTTTTEYFCQFILSALTAYGVWHFAHQL